MQGGPQRPVFAPGPGPPAGPGPGAFAGGAAQPLSQQSSSNGPLNEAFARTSLGAAGPAGPAAPRPLGMPGMPMPGGSAPPGPSMGMPGPGGPGGGPMMRPPGMPGMMPAPNGPMAGPPAMAMGPQGAMPQGPPRTSIPGMPPPPPGAGTRTSFSGVPGMPPPPPPSMPMGGMPPPFGGPMGPQSAGPSGMMMPPPPPGGGPPQFGPPAGFAGAGMGGMPPPPGGMMPPPGAPRGPPPPGQMMPPPGPPGPPGMPPPPPGYGPPPQRGPMGGMGGMPPPLGAGGPPGPPGMPQQGMPGMQQPQGMSNQSRIDPASMPRPVISSNAGPCIYETRVPGQSYNPPPAASRYVVRDRGNAGPRYLRSTLNQVPFSADLLSNSGMPLALMVSPLALPEPEDDQISVVDMGELGPVRCARCKAYLNPFMRFMSSGKTFICNFCSHTNNTPEQYFCFLGPDGRRRDADERPELNQGSVEYVATRDYMIRPPMLSTHLFLIDASPAAVLGGALATACSCISRALEEMPSPERVQIALVTFDSAVQFYSLKPGAAQPSMLIMSDVVEPFVPDSAPLLLNLAEHKDGLQALLAQIPGMFAGSRSSESCAGAGIEAALAALQPCGGKVHCFLATLPTLGIHTLKLRDGVGIGDKDKLAVLASQDNTLKSLAGTAAEFQICIDICLLAQGYMDIASLSDLTTTTGGTLYQYTPFNPALDHDQVLNDLTWNVVRPQGMEAIMRVRCSQGIEVESYVGALYKQAHNPTDVYLPAVDCDKAVMATLRLNEKLNPGAECYVQAALLYTSVEGYRRIRVHTLALPVVDTYGSVFKGADLDSQTMWIARRLAGNLPGGTLAAARDSVTSSTVATLAAYRKFCAAQSSPVQLILPEALKLLPLYALSLFKGAALRDGVKVDERSLWMSQMMSLTCARITPLLYPRLLPLHRVLDGSETMEQLPDGLVLSSDKLEQGGVYLLENGSEAYLHLHRGVEPAMVQQLLGFHSYEDLLKVQQPIVLLPREEPAAKALQEVLSKVRIHRSSFLRLRVTRKGDLHEAAFFSMLVEDKSTAGVSYVEYLCSVHKAIQLKLQ